MSDLNLQKLLERGKQHFLHNDYVDSIKYFTDVIENSNEDLYTFEGYCGRSLVYFALNKHHESIEDSIDASSIFPNNPKSVFIHAQNLFALQKYEAAKKKYYSALARSRDEESKNILKNQIITCERILFELDNGLLLHRLEASEPRLWKNCRIKINSIFKNTVFSKKQNSTILIGDRDKKNAIIINIDWAFEQTIEKISNLGYKLVGIIFTDLFIQKSLIFDKFNRYGLKKQKLAELTCRFPNLEIYISETHVNFFLNSTGDLDFQNINVYNHLKKVNLGKSIQIQVFKSISSEDQYILVNGILLINMKENVFCKESITFEDALVIYEIQRTRMQFCFFYSGLINEEISVDDIITDFLIKKKPTFDL